MSHWKHTQDSIFYNVGKIPLTGDKFRQMVGSAFIYLLSVDYVAGSIPRAGVH